MGPNQTGNVAASRSAKVFRSQVDQIVMMFIVLYILMLVLSSLCKTDQE